MYDQFELDGMPDPTIEEIAAARERHMAAERSELRKLAKGAHLIQDELERRVERLRAAGASWAFIGSALGVTRQAAQQRYGSVSL